MKSKVATMCLCLCLATGLAGCGSAAQPEETAVSEESAASVDNGRLTEDSGVVAVGKTTVPFSEYKVYDTIMKSRYEDTFTSEVWEYAGAVTGKTIGEEAVEELLRMLIQTKIICKAAAAEGVTLAADEKEQADYDATQFLAGFSEQEKQENGITASAAAKVFEENRLAEKMYHVVIGKENVEFTADQVKAVKVQMLYKKADDTNREQVRTEMAELRQKAKQAEGSFYPFAKENTDAAEVECLIGAMDQRTALKDAALALKKYKMSEVIEEDDGFYLVYCIETSKKAVNNAYKNQMVEEKQLQAFQKSYKEWSEKYEVKISRSLLAN